MFYQFFVWSVGSISSPVRYSYLLIFLGDNADIFRASLLISYCKFLSLILLSIIIIRSYRIYKVFKVNIWWLIKCNLLNSSFVSNFHNKIVFIYVTFIYSWRLQIYNFQSSTKYMYFYLHKLLTKTDLNSV